MKKKAASSQSISGWKRKLPRFEKEGNWEGRQDESKKKEIDKYKEASSRSAAPSTHRRPQILSRSASSSSKHSPAATNPELSGWGGVASSAAANLECGSHRRVTSCRCPQCVDYCVVQVFPSFIGIYLKMSQFPSNVAWALIGLLMGLDRKFLSNNLHKYILYN
jgi:hypothetical protein